jgi:hypothetical protein
MLGGRKLKGQGNGAATALVGYRVRDPKERRKI